MVRRRVMKGVLANFLSTYSSRYSEYDGYWLFGFLVQGSDLRIDLLSPIADQGTPVGTAIQTAVARYADQMQKAGLAMSVVSQAWLVIETLPGAVDVLVDHRPCKGSKVRLAATAVMDNGRRFERHLVLLAAPHNPQFESRSNPA